MTNGGWFSEISAQHMFTAELLLSLFASMQRYSGVVNAGGVSVSTSQSYKSIKHSIFHSSNGHAATATITGTFCFYRLD